MQVLIVESDRWMRDLLRQVVLSLSPQAKVDHFSDVYAASEACRPGIYQLVLCEVDLPSGSGLGLLDRLRKRGCTMPFVMLTERADRGAVLAARARGATEFIAKPFDVERLQNALRPFLPADGAAVELPPAAADIRSHLDELDDAALDLPLMSGVRRSLDEVVADATSDASDLARRWQNDPALTARLIAIANSVRYNPQATSCTSLAAAITRIGWKMSLSVAMGLALRRAGELDDPRLAARAARELEHMERVGELAEAYAQSCGLDPVPCHTAALLHRLGELSVLFHLQDCLRHGMACDEATIDWAITTYAAPFADRLKRHWSLPIGLRQLIGAIYGYGMGSGSHERFFMRLAGGTVHGGMTREEEGRLRRHAGLPLVDVSAAIRTKGSATDSGEGAAPIAGAAPPHAAPAEGSQPNLSENDPEV